MSVENAANVGSHDTLLQERIAQYAIRTQARSDQWMALVTPQPGVAVPGSLQPVHFPISVDDRDPSLTQLPRAANRASIQIDDHTSIAITPEEHGDTAAYALSLIRDKGYPYIESVGQEFYNRELRKMMLTIKARADANPNVVLANGAASVNALGADDVLTLNALRRIRVILTDEQGAPMFNTPGSTMPAYHALLPTACISDLALNRNDVNGLADPQKYLARPELAMTGEIGMIEGFRVIRQTSDLVTSLGAVNGTKDLVTCHFAGAQYIGGVVNNPPAIFWEERPGDWEKRFWQFRTYGIYGFGMIAASNGLRFRARSKHTEVP